MKSERVDSNQGRKSPEALKEKFQLFPFCPSSKIPTTPPSTIFIN